MVHGQNKNWASNQIVGWWHLWPVCFLLGLILLPLSEDTQYTYAKLGQSLSLLEPPPPPLSWTPGVGLVTVLWLQPVTVALLPLHSSPWLTASAGYLFSATGFFFHRPPGWVPDGRLGGHLQVIGEGGWALGVSQITGKLPGDPLLKQHLNLGKLLPISWLSCKVLLNFKGIAQEYPNSWVVGSAPAASLKTHLNRLWAT